MSRPDKADEVRVSVSYCSRSVVVENSHIAATCSLETGQLGLADKRRDDVGIPNAFPAARINDRWYSLSGTPIEDVEERPVRDAIGAGAECELKYRTGAGWPDIRLAVRAYEGRPVVFFRLILRNDGSEPVSVGRVHVLQAASPNGGARGLQRKRPSAFHSAGLHGGAVELGSGLEKARIYLESNNLCWTGVIDLFSATPAVRDATPDEPGADAGDLAGCEADTQKGPPGSLRGDDDGSKVLDGTDSGRGGGVSSRPRAILPASGPDGIAQEEPGAIVSACRAEMEIEASGHSRMDVHRSGGMSLIWNPGARLSFLAGFTTADLALTRIETTASPSKHTVREWCASCSYDGLAIEPGEELSTEELCLGFGTDPLDTLEAYGRLLASRNDTRPSQSTPQLWCSWYSHFGAVTEENILRNAAVIAERFRPHGVDTVQIDYGWNWRHTPGEWRRGGETFPHGMKWLSGRLQEMGLNLGLWVAPFYIGEQSAFFEEHPEALLRDPRTGNPVSFRWAWETQPADTRQTAYLLDTTHPVSQAFLKDAFREMASWGVNYFKLDFLDGGSQAPLSFSSRPENSYRIRDGEQMRRGLAAIREAVGGDAYILAGNLPITHGIGIVSAVFAAMDVGIAAGNYSGLKNRMTTFISRYYQQKLLWHNDPDVINLSGRCLDGDAVCSEGEARIRLTAVGLSGGPVLLGDDLPALSEERLEMYTLCLPACGKSARPVDLFTSDYPRIWDMKVISDWGEWDVVGLFNYDAEEIAIPVSFEALGLDADREYLVWEFWGQEFIGRCRERVDVSVAEETAKVLLIKREEGHPIVLSTSLHLGQGACELSGVKWDKKKRVLSGTASRHPDARGSIFLHVPPSAGLKVKGFEVEGARAACWAAAAGRSVDDSVYSLDLVFEQADVDWRVEFG